MLNLNVTSNYELDRPLPIGKSKKVIGLIKDELEVKISWIKKENFQLLNR